MTSWRQEWILDVTVTCAVHYNAVPESHYLEKVHTHISMYSLHVFVTNASQGSHKK